MRVSESCHKANKSAQKASAAVLHVLCSLSRSGMPGPETLEHVAGSWSRTASECWVHRLEAPVSCCTASPQEAGSQEKQDPSHGEQKQAHPSHFSYSTLSQTPLTVCRWPSASECRTCCSKGQSPVCNWKWFSMSCGSATLSTRMLGLGETTSVHLGALAAVSVQEVVG